MGARSCAMGYTSSCLSDEWSLLNNVGGLGEIEDVRVAFASNLHPALGAFNRHAAVITGRVGPVTAAAGAFRFGDKLYSEQIVAAGFGNRLGLASLGIKFQLVQYRAEGFGARHVFTVSFGGIAQLSENLLVGASITNINQPMISDDEKVPGKMNMGLMLRPSARVAVTAEIEKDLDRPVVWKTGTEYRFHKKFVIRTGFNLNPDAIFAGAGFSGKFQFDYAVHYSFNAGINHHASVTLKIPRS